MGESGGSSDQQSDAERRILRARAAIGKSFEELIARGESGGSPAPIDPEPGRSAGVPNGVGVAQPVRERDAGIPGRPEIDELIDAVERRVLDRIERRGGDQGAALDARVAAAEAALRSRLRVELDERSSEQSRRIGEEAAAFRKRINEEVAGALQGTAAELRRQLEAEREGARRELSRGAREQVESAVGRLDELKANAVRESRQAAEEVAASRIAGARSEIAKQLESSRARSNEGIDRGLSGLDARAREMFAALREEQEAAASEQREEVRQRSEARIDELAGELSARIEGEVRRRLDEVKAELARAQAESASLMQTETVAGAEVAIRREVAKGEARLAAKSVEVEVDRKVAESVEAHTTAFREELAASSYREHSRQAEAAAAAQLSGSLEALNGRQSALATELTELGEAERARIEADIGRSLSAAKDELDRRVAELLTEAEAGLGGLADAAVSVRLQDRAAAWEQQIGGRFEGAAEAGLRRVSEAAVGAERRLASAEHAQRREEAVRTRVRAAEREAEERVRAAERRLAEVLATIASAAGGR